jgi:hypothetical protein
VGIGVLGALFNVLTLPRLGMLEARGISPAALLDAHARGQIPPEILRSAGQAIGAGLFWVFVGMLVVGILQAIVTAWMPGKQGELHISKLEMAEAIGG